MRIWSLHPAQLDAKGLVACWRESLLAQAVLDGRTRGYTRHPQLQRFRETADPLGAIGAYLCAVAGEADRRGYRFDRSRILHPECLQGTMEVTSGQLALEWQHLLAKLAVRDPERLARATQSAGPEPHPLFRVIDGPPAEWERAPGEPAEPR